MRARALVAAGCALLLTGCALPLQHGVKTVRVVRHDVQQQDNLKVIPPAPKPGQSPVDVVTGFLGAQSNADGEHAIAREFLTSGEAAVWDDRDQIRVYDSDTLAVQIVHDDPTSARVAVSVTMIGEVGRDSGYTAQVERVRELYDLVKADTRDDWRLSSVPDGLRLTTADLLRGFRPLDVYYLAPAVAATHVPHVVPDRVFLAQGPGLAKALASRLLTPPTTALSGAVSLGLPQGMRLAVRSVTQETDGLVTVDLSGPVEDLTGAQRQDLSARLVWTLRQVGLTRLRLLGDGKVVSVPGADSPQDAGAYDGYDPEGLGADPPYYFVVNRRLRASEPLGRQAAALTSSPLTAKGSVGVDEIAVTPDRTRIAVLSHRSGATVDVHVGALSGASFPRVASGADLTSPSWGSGEYGLWLLSGDRDIMLVDPTSKTMTRVPVSELPAGRLTSLAMSRDGARMAVVAGGHVYVAPVQVQEGRPRPGRFAPVALAVQDATQVVWSDSTGLLARTGGANPQVFRLLVDGSGPVQVPTGVAPLQIAAGGGAVVVASGTALYSTRSLVPVQPRGASPVFPG